MNNVDYIWQPISTFDSELFTLMSDGTPDGTEVIKYKGTIPEWARLWMPLPSLLKRQADTNNKQESTQHAS